MRSHASRYDIMQALICMSHIKKTIWMLLRKIKSGLRRLGWLRDPRVFIFSHVASEGVAAEVGVWKGDFSEIILKHNKPKKLYLVDPWQFQPEFSDRMFGGSVATSQSDMDDIFAGVEARLAAYDSVEFVREFSDRAAEVIPDESLDWAYIDGNHYFDYVLADLKLYGTKVVPGGFIVGDDYWWRPTPDGELEVKAAVSEFLATQTAFRWVTEKDGQFLLQKKQ